LDGGRAHPAVEPATIAIAHLAEQHLVTLEVLDLEGAEAVKDSVESLDIGVGPAAQPSHLALPRLAHLASNVGLGALSLELGEIGLELLGPCLDVGIATIGDLLLLDAQLGLEGRQRLMSTLDVDPRDHVGGEVDDLLEILRSKVEQVAQTTWDTLEVPDMRDGSRQLDVAHPLATDLRTRDLNTATLTDDALEAHPLVLAAVALPVTGRSEDLLAEQAILLRLEGAVVDRLGLLNLTVRPGTDVLRAGKADSQFIEEVDV